MTDRHDFVARKVSDVISSDLEVTTPDLLRAAPLHLLLRRYGLVFRQSLGTAETFEMSEPVENIDWFLSHSWRTPGWLKTVALLARSNALGAFCAWLLILAVSYILKLAYPTAFEWQEVNMYVGGAGKIDTLVFDLWCPLTYIVLLGGLCFGQELRPTRWTNTCFLDKCCIHQTDEEKKRKGIEQLGGFLSRSEKMVILWQPEYLTRLWCVYELAAFSFLKLHISNSIDLIPLKLPVMVLTFLTLHVVASTLSMALMPRTLFSEWFGEILMERDAISGACLLYLFGFGLFAIGTYPLLSLPLWRFCTHHVEDRIQLLHQLRTFRVSKAECFMESDREFVVSRIELWFGSVDNFEELVQQHLWEKVKAQLEGMGLVPFRYVMFGALPHVCLLSSSTVEALRVGDWDMFARCLLTLACSTGLCDGLSLGLCLRLALRERRSPSSWMYRYGGAVYVILCFSSISSITVILVSPAIPLWAATLITAICVFAAVFFYKPIIFAPPPLDTSEVVAKLSAYRNESRRRSAAALETNLVVQSIGEASDQGDDSDTDSEVHSV